MRLLIALILLAVGLCDAGSQYARGVNGGTDCATCTVLLGMTEQLSEIHNESVTHSLERLCSFLPDPLRDPCRTFADFFGPFLINLITEKDTPDTVCNALGFCYHESGQPACRVYPPPTADFNDLVKAGKARVAHLQDKMPVPKICSLPGIKEICKWIEDSVARHDPALDLDHDYHSTMPTLRGTSWRGRDCNDDDESIYPGTRPNGSDILTDSNCNGIYGKDPTTGHAYEDLLCGKSQPRGVAVLGDSVSAHFHLPEEWFDSQKLSVNVFKDALFILENEIDWPELSTITGYTNNSWSNVIHGNMNSVYQYLWERNRCNHRDYQNIAANGARSSSMLDIMLSLQRNQQRDYPMVIFYALIGNDVCNGHPDTFAHMTTPEQMRENAMKTLHYLDKTLPNNSYVILSGLADGRVLYDSLHDRIHPIGRLHNDVTYPDFYDYFNCLQISPCTGWMNTNETVRNLTTARAEELSAVLKDIADKNPETFTHFKLYYFDCPIQQVFREWKAKGKQTWQLLEPVDGFHSNQVGQALTAAVIWNNLEKTLPEVIGPVNPYNEQIEKLFGDQGGY